MDFSGYEYTVEQRTEGSLLIRKILFIALYIAFVFAWIVMGVLTRILVPLLALIPLTTAILVYFTWLYCRVEFEYSVVSGELAVTAIYGNRKRAKMTEVRIKDIVMVAPWDDEAACEKASQYGVEKSYFAVSSKNAPGIYFALFENAKGKNCIIYFEPDEKLIKLLKFYNNPAVITAK